MNSATAELNAPNSPETQSAVGCSDLFCGTVEYKTIVADPPWPMPETGKRTPASSDKLGTHEAKGGRTVDGAWWKRFTGKTVKLPYQTMTLDEIKALQMPAAADAHLYLWTTGRYVLSGEACDVARSWGFRPAQLLTWCKTPMGIGFGGAFCNTTEFVIFCRRGRLKHRTRIDSTWWKWGRPYENGHIAHSAKPEAFQDMVMEVSPGPYLEVFARRQRLGWHTCGNEALEHVRLVPPNSKVSDGGGQ